jgi:peptidoglycan/LPS O-acetylase OafA/YrhL
MSSLRADGTETAGESRRHAHGLDGIRALAVSAVVGYHLGVPGLDGGLLGVSVFFTLSGYLITSLLLAEQAARGSIALGPFWIRRARRLLPAAWALLASVLIAAAAARHPKLGDWARQALFALLYVANWATIARGDDYFSRFAGPGPLDHLWSLAIEEQFYLVWPTVALGLSRLRSRRTALALLGAMIAASTLTLAWLHDPTAVNNTRAYEGTDARAAALLVGAMAAWLAPFDRLGASPGSRRLDALGAASFVVVVACVAGIDERGSFFYRGGELLLSVATACWVVAVAHPSSLLARALSSAPLRWLGDRSYGIYLWHMPVIALVSGGGPVVEGVARVALTLALSAASYAWLEEPIRRRHPLTGPRARRLAAVVPVAVLALFLAQRPATWSRAAELSVATAASSVASSSASPASASPSSASPGPGGASASGSSGPSASSSPSGSSPSGSSPSAVPAPEVLQTSCKTVIHIGDSTSVSLVSKDFIPKTEEQLEARYRGVGVEAFVSAISGARSIVEKWEGKPSAWEIVHEKHGSGYTGCWVFALGTNDPANIKGNLPGLAKRIEWMMIQAEGRPVLWTSSRSLLRRGPYDDAYMRSWNQALLDACARYPNMRVFDWAAETRDAWFQPDGIHPNPVGARERAWRFAAALAKAFPKQGPSPAGCFVRAAP